MLSTTLGVRCDRRDRAGVAARRGAQRQPPDRPARDDRDGAQRRLRARAAPPTRPTPTLIERRLPRSRADHPAGVPVRPPRRRDRARLLRAAARGRRRHGDPRLHPLSADRADAPAHARPERQAGHLGPLAGASSVAALARARRPGAPRASERGRLPLPVHRRRRGLPRRSARASCRCRSSRSSTSRCRSAEAA